MHSFNYRISIIRYLLTVSFFIVVTIFQQGCMVPTLHGGGIICDDSNDIAPESKPTETEEFTVESTMSQQEKEISPSEMINQAREMCRKKDFYGADSLLQVVATFAADNDGLSIDDSIIAPDRYLTEIMTIYTELMPDTFSVPDEVAYYLFQMQLKKSLDSMDFSPKDSMIVGEIMRNTGVVYDVPVIWNKRVEMALYYYITRRKLTIDHWRTRSTVYLPFMRKMFADNSLPRDLAYLPLIESGFNPKAYSRAHASGIWQFIRSTGKRYGLRANYWIDERRDPVRSTNAAIRYLTSLYAEFGHWHLALAAYNCGEGGVRRAIEKYREDDYWQLKLPKETMNYVPLYLAALTIAKKQGLGSEIPSEKDTIPFDTVCVKDCISLSDISEGIGLDYDLLKKINPHILRWCTPPDMSDIQLYFPSGYGQKFRKFFSELPDEKKVKWYRYRIRPGDNLGSIARSFRLPIEGIKSVNRIKGSQIIAGKYLFIPIPVGASGFDVHEENGKSLTAVKPTPIKIPENARHVVYEVKPGDTMWQLGELFGVTTQQIRSWNGLKSSRLHVGQIISLYQSNDMLATDTLNTSQSIVKSTGKKKNSDVYVVKKGDNAYRIAHSNGMTLDKLYSMNGITSDASMLHPGDTLRVEKNGAIQTEKNDKNIFSGPSDRIVYVVSAGDNLYRIAQNFSLSVDKLRRVNKLSASSLINIGDTIYIPQVQSISRKNSEKLIKEMIYYTVKNGDNLWRIADAFGVSVQQLYEENNLHAASVLMPGDTIRVFRRSEL